MYFYFYAVQTIYLQSGTKVIKSFITTLHLYPCKLDKREKEMYILSIRTTVL